MTRARAKPAARPERPHPKPLTIVSRLSPAAAETGTPSRPLAAAFAFGALATILLALAAVPPWVVRRPRVAVLLVEWRVQIAAAGFSTLFVAGIVLLIGTTGV